MIGATATVTEMQNDFGRYLDLVMKGHEVIVTKNGKEVGRFIPKDASPPDGFPAGNFAWALGP